jgi:predicted SprT family Zn-dependent metalloprotease
MTNTQTRLDWIRTLLTEYNLDGWSIDIRKLKNYWGYCNYRKKTITLADRLLKFGSDDSFMDTVIHEIAHALTPVDKGHGVEWQTKTASMGGNPSRTGSHPEVPNTYLWRGECSGCGRVVHKHRLSENHRLGYIYHMACGPSTEYTNWTKGEFVVHEL